MPGSATRHVAVASRTILACCCVVFLWQLLHSPWGQLAPQALGFTPAYFFAGGPPAAMFAWVPYGATLITYMFLHASWPHLLGNMLCLWIFGDEVEESLGQPAFIVFYLLTGMAAALAQALLDPASTRPVVGASGAVSGLFGAWLVLHPRSGFNLRVPILIVVDAVRLPAWLVLLFWFGVQLLYDMLGTQAGGGVAFRAHLGGFVAGMLLAPLFRRVTRRRRLAAAGDRLLR